MPRPVLRLWRPGRLPWWIEIILLANVGLRSLIRGWDYMDGDNEGVSVVLGVAEKVMTIQAWGVLFMIVAAVLLVGVLTRRRLILAVGMAIGAAAYFSITIAMADVVAGKGWDGARTPSDTLWTAFLCAGLMVAYIIEERTDIARESRRHGT